MSAPSITETAPDARLADPWVIAVANQKGGVGKTTLALGLAATTVDSSGKAYVIDVDPQRSAEEIAATAGDNLPFEFTASADPAALGQLRRARGYDTVIVDTPGSLENQGILRQVLKSADLVLIPFVPERQAITPTMNTAALVASTGVPYRVVLNLADPLRGPGPVEAAWQLLDEQGIPRLRTVVRRYVAHSQSQLDGLMVTQYRGDSSWRKALDDMRKLQTELLLILGRMDRR